jgi:miniconductance mechanosensitive channel
MIIAGWGLYKRILKSIEKYYELKQDFYRITAIRAITQSLNIVGIFFFIFLGITNIFGVSSTAIFGSLTAMMAVLMLVFKDTILGFVTGIHVSTSKNLKVGDWIGIPKYNIDGNILDISLLTTKILNFDKTVSTIPTYDLMSTEIRNNQVMAEGRVRRIKRSIIFNIYSFKFADAEFLDRLMKINLISEYLETRRREISDLRAKISNPELLINGKQLTNIGIFRKYVQNYLSKNPNIEKKEGILVRQLEVSPQGMPLEIYCFAKRENTADFENIVADIFDHLLSSFKIFDLEIVQINKS